MRRPSIARRIALIAAVATAVTALVSAAVLLVLLGFRLTSANLRTAENLVAAMDAGITQERFEQPTLESAAREFLDELALDGARREVWGPSGLIARGRLGVHTRYGSSGASRWPAMPGSEGSRAEPLLRGPFREKVDYSNLNRRPDGGVTPVSTRHSPWQFPLRPYSR